MAGRFSAAAGPLLGRLLPFVILFSALAAIVTADIKGDLHLLHYACKPLTTLLMLLYVWRSGNAPSPRYRLTIMGGILLSACGDVFLMLPSALFAQGFLCGLASFLIAHLLFLRAFTTDAPWFGKRLVLPAFVVVGAANLFILWPGLTDDLRVPVLIYVGFLIAMTSQAVSRFLTLKTAGSGFAAFGGIIFLLSDTLIAYNKFHTPLVAAGACILTTYYLALWLIARSACSEHLKLKV